MTSSAVRENLEAIESRISAAAQQSGRRREHITLIAVSKTHPAEAIRAAYDAGLRHFGENRVQEWEGKRDALSSLDATFHLIGHLQSNKAVKAARFFHCIDSVDDLGLAQRLDRARAEFAAPGKLRVLLEVHIASEESKSGVTIAELPMLAEQILPLPNLELAGLMCIPPFSDDPANARPYFQRMQKLREHLETQLSIKLPVLSMGMSHDFEVAIQEGATEIRLGTALFGQRPSPVAKV